MGSSAEPDFLHMPKSSLTCDWEVEEAAINMLMNHEESQGMLLDRLVSADFTQVKYREIFDVAAKLLHESVGIESITVVHKLRDEGNLALVGGSAEVVRIAETLFLAENTPVFIKLLKKATAYRNIAVVSSTLANTVSSGYIDDSPDELAAKAINALSQHVAPDNPYMTISAIHDTEVWEADQEYRLHHPEEFAAWPWKTLRDKLGTWRTGELIVVGAATHGGKSLFASSCAASQGLNGVPVAIFTPEMSRAQYGRRLLNAAKQWRPGVPDADIRALMKDLDKCPIYVDELGRELEELCARIRMLKYQKQIQVAYIDHFGLVEWAKKNHRDSEANILGHMAETFHKLAQELCIDIVLLCQFNRFTKRQKSRPTTADIRDSGKIENAADLILLLSFTSDWDESAAAATDAKDGFGHLWYRSVTVDVVKNRNGFAKGPLELGFDSNSGRLEDLP